MSKRNPARKLLGGLAVAAVVLILAECGVRILISIRADLQPIPNPGPKPGVRLSPDRGWEALPAYHGFTFRTKRHYDRRGFLAVDGKQIDAGATNRILVIGDSNTFGFRTAVEDTYPEVLDASLPTHAVINLAFPGYSSFQGLQTLRLLGDQVSPSIIVACFNFNDRRYVFDATGQDDAANFAATISRSASPSPLSRLGLFKLLRYIAVRAGLISFDNGEGPYDIGTFVARVPPDAYRANLEAIAGFAEARGARAIFVILNDNPDAVANIRAGMAHIESGQLAEAVEILSAAALNNETYTTLARMQLSRAYTLMNRSDKAQSARWVENVYQAFDGGEPLHPDALYNRIMREVAIEQGVDVVEAGRTLNNAGGVYFDFCHVNEHGHYLIARELAALIGGSETGMDAENP